jgi:hypothetical protein
MILARLGRRRLGAAFTGSERHSLPAMQHQYVIMYLKGGSERQYGSCE